MKRHLNTLFVTLEGAYLRKDGAAVEICHEGESKLRVPLHNLDGIACFGWDISCSAILMAACAEAKVALSFHTPHGKFLAASNGFTSGNILLRREQYRRADHEPAAVSIASNMIAAKLANSRHVLMRTARDHGSKCPERAFHLNQAADLLAIRIGLATRATTLDSLRGIEGDAGAAYFAAFPHLMVNHDPEIRMSGRSRRPPLDPINALLSFLYVLLMHDCRSALESCGLDAQCGFLHRDRPGRPSLALDLMEEFRAWLADRTALSLINRQQVTSRDFETKENGAVLLRDDSRKKILTAWQERKQVEINHPFLDEKTTVGLLPHLQARLLARHLRGDLDAYPAFLAR
ncbi:CRISPR-associated protein Cas1 [Haloferula luteola]|uniref:CRISPR-associated endonuclease Cas1 n=1 Tax=Haloferula luteola TaxID=595692 RepID=A0A840V6U4_9BACT|nr:type I-C CRISPR-associated endonuclease Cas1c [Haloferula luteola]MBB5353692.1 CRISPR-associated protein Cas1 [Haloferula luteola]